MPSEKPTWESTGITGLVRHAPSGMYYHRYSVVGKRTYHSLKTRKFPTAKLKLAKAQEGVQLARMVTSEGPTDDNLKTLGDFSRLFFLRLQHSELDDKTVFNWRLCERRLTAVWPEWEDCAVARVSKDRLLQLRTAMRERKHTVKAGQRLAGGYAPASVNKVLSFLRTLVDMARQKRVLFSSPFDRQEGDSTPLFLSVPKEPIHFPSRAEMERLFSALEAPCVHSIPNLQARFDRQAVHVGEMTRFLAYSGARHKEATAAQWEDWDEVRGTIKIRGTKSETSVRAIPVNSDLRSLLVAIRERRGGEITGPILKVTTINHSLIRVGKSLGMPHFSMHSLRHYFATVCIESGVDIPTVSRWLGHADGGALAMRTYGHLRDEHSRNAAKLVSFSVAV